jgi:hypothetical protein
MDQTTPGSVTELPEAAKNPLATGVIQPQGGGSSCTCGCSGGAATPVINYPFIYALGQIQPRFPSPGIEKEFAQVARLDNTAGLIDSQVRHSVLSKRENRYLVRRMCWILTVGSIESYLLQPRDPGDFQLLVDALRPEPQETDIDVVIGQRGPIASPELCNGLLLPIVAFDQVYSFDINALVGGIPVPKQTSQDRFLPPADELFRRILLMADNAGASDEHRALNYLAVRYDRIYHQAAQCCGENKSLTSVDVRPSRLSGARKVVEVIFTYTHRQTDVADRYFVRVDTTEEFPFLASKLAPFFEV